MGEAIIELAESEGMPHEDERTPEHEFYHDAWDDAENWLNDHCAGAGFYFGTNESGDFMYMRDEHYVYIIDIDERGEFRAHVEHVAQDGAGMIEIDVAELIESGYMKHKTDIDGLYEHLVDAGILTNDATLTRLND